MKKMKKVFKKNYANMKSFKNQRYHNNVVFL